ncbi:MAG: hypothetical protein IIC72_11600 [Acidobacteria bacterium]|nr:hypothetical protein [Acidobacteriota bacterium]TDI52549.1 MAG: hypothetical protein E2O97_02480 [Acidobacteriota bacterium]TDI56521.1 MAG: hypothetical protein E2O96_02755 [Acidobacteriota bacterium]
MSELLETAAAALGMPTDLVQRSAAARATENGTTVDDVLTAWAGGAPIAVAVPSAEAQPSEPVVEAPVSEAPPAAVVVLDPPVIEVPAAIEEVPVEAEPEERLEPVSMGRRIKTAVRVGAWTGAALGLVGFLVAGAFWADTTTAIPDTGPIVQVDATGVLIGAALVSILFGAIVASLSRTAAASTDPAMQLSESKGSTAWIGAAMGLILGIVAGVLLTAGFGTEIEGGEGLIQLPVLPTLTVMLVGGAVLGAVTSLVPQLFGTPVAVSDDDEKEVAEVKKRLGQAVSIPMSAAVILLLLVLPFAYILIQSNELTSGGAAIIAVLVASGILGFATLAGGKPEMRITGGDLLVAVAGIGTVLLILLAVLLINSGEGPEEGAPEEQTAIVLEIV